jgi:hypothetical protein
MCEPGLGVPTLEEIKDGVAMRPHERRAAADQVGSGS